MTPDPYQGYEQMVRLVGKRHAKCWFSNYEVGNDEHTKLRQIALDTAKQYARSLKHNKGDGRNLIMMGDVGTGKDHLAIAVMRAAAIGLRMSARMRRGSELCNECRMNLLNNGKDVPHDLTEVELLVISDIEPNPIKPASEFEDRAFLELIDQRYRNMLPTVVTSNKNSKQEIAESIGRRSADRLFENADIALFTWPSYRGQ
jgi:DNA replication protein DnaC